MAGKGNPHAMPRWHARIAQLRAYQASDLADDELPLSELAVSRFFKLMAKLDEGDGDTSSLSIFATDEGLVSIQTRREGLVITVEISEAGPFEVLRMNVPEFTCEHFVADWRGVADLLKPRP